MNVTQFYRCGDCGQTYKTMEQAESCCRRELVVREVAILPTGEAVVNLSFAELSGKFSTGVRFNSPKIPQSLQCDLKLPEASNGSLYPYRVILDRHLGVTCLFRDHAGGEAAIVGRCRVPLNLAGIKLANELFDRSWRYEV